MDKDKTVIANKKRTKTLISLILIMVTLCFSITATYAWYQVQFNAVFVLDVDASGILYLYLEVPVDNMQQGDDRFLSPAVAMPYAVANGLYMNPLVEYNPQDANPSYVAKAANQKTYSGNFTLLQGYGIVSNLHYKISMRAGSGLASEAFSKSDFVYTGVDFIYYDTVLVDPETLATEIVPVNPLISQSADNMSGVLTITSSQKVFFNVTISFANVDELVDPRIMTQSSIWCEMSLVVEGMEEE